MDPRNRFALRLHDLLLAFMARAGLMLFADEPAIGSESLLASGTSTTDSAGEQGTATGDDAGTTDTTTKAEGTEDGKTADGTDTKTEDTKDGDKPAGAPEAYEFKAPEGFELDEQMLAEYTPVFKELNLPQDAAQRLVDLAPKLIAQTATRTTAQVLEQLGLADHAKWADQVKADPEIGGDKQAETIGLANKAIAQFFPKTAPILVKLGLGNHPDVIRELVRVGKAISEDGFVPGGKTVTTPPAASLLYDASNMNP